MDPHRKRQNAERIWAAIQSFRWIFEKEINLCPRDVTVSDIEKEAKAIAHKISEKHRIRLEDTLEKLEAVRDVWRWIGRTPTEKERPQFEVERLRVQKILDGYTKNYQAHPHQREGDNMARAPVRD